MARVFISRHNLYEPTYLLNVLAVVLTANAMPNWLAGSIRQYEGPQLPCWRHKQRQRRRQTEIDWEPQLATRSAAGCGASASAPWNWAGAKLSRRHSMQLFSSVKIIKLPNGKRKMCPAVRWQWEKERESRGSTCRTCVRHSCLPASACQLGLIPNKLFSCFFSLWGVFTYCHSSLAVGDGWAHTGQLKCLRCTPQKERES